MASGDRPTGRVTAKGAAPGSKRVTPKGSMPSSGRYTPPVPKEYKVSPRWVPVLMFTLLGVGMLMIVTNYLGVLPGGAKNTYLLIGLGLITGGFVTATRYH
ncbi:MAG: cell division protein CrgA [Actinobacteria bacterium]|nr:cell division protein CrgA [Actinomycetota bacterium]